MIEIVFFVKMNFTQVTNIKDVEMTYLFAFISVLAVFDRTSSSFLSVSLSFVRPPLNFPCSLQVSHEPTFPAYQHPWRP